LLRGSYDLGGGRSLDDGAVLAVMSDDNPSSVTHIITATAGAGGGISPSGAITVTEGSNQTFTITATEGYRVSDVEVDGSSVGAVTSYTFTSVTAAHTIAAMFVEADSPTYTVTFDANGGTVFPTTAQTGADGKLPSLPTPTRSGSYSFDGWYTTESGGTKVTTATVFSENTTVYAHWTYTDSSGGDSGGGSSSGTSATISISTATYYTGDGKDITVTLTPGNYTLIDIKNGNTTLIKGTDYTVDGNTVTIKAAYLATLATGEHKLTFDMSDGTDPVLTVTIEDGEPPLGAWTNPFADVKESDWFYGDVQYAYLNGLFNGTSATTFSPQMPMTRGMLVTVLGRLAGVDVSKYTASSFDDVATDQYYAAYVEWAKENGIVAGIGDNLFAPDADITRQDMAVILYRYAQFMDIDLPKKKELLPFADDADVASYAEEALYAMQEAGIISGKPGNLADPKGKTMRAEVAAMLHRFAEAIAE
jgi:uncharacterized repeat protein (TIGR02543 family)